MKLTVLSLFLLQITLYSCGQTDQKTISLQDSTRVRFYESKSISKQEKQPDSAMYFASKGLKLSRDLKYQYGEALMLKRFAALNSYYGNFKLAFKYQAKAFALFTSLHDQAAAANAATDLGLLQGELGNYQKGRQLIKAAISQFKQANNTEGTIMAYTKLGELCDLQGDSSLALTYYSKAEQLNKGLPLSNQYFALINNMGKLHAKLGNQQQAVSYYETGIKQSASKSNSREHIALLNNAGKALDKLGNKQKALAYHYQALQKSKALDLHEDQARSLIGIAHVLKNQNADQSITHLKNALSIAHAIGHKHLSAEIYYSLSEIYKQQSQFDQALKALEEHHRLLDSLLTNQKNDKIAVLQHSYELAESQLNVENLELANRQKTYQRNFSITLTVAALIILLALAWYFYKTSQINKQLKLSNQIKDKLFSIIGHDLRSPVGGVAHLLAIMEEDENMKLEEIREMIQLLRKQSDAALEILISLLNWGETQLRGIHIKPVVFSPVRIISKNLKALNKHATDKSIELSNHIPQDLEVLGDADHFDFIIRNLISNAIKFSFPFGKIEIDSESTGKQVVFSVKDHGKGISEAQQQLFLTSNLDVEFGTSGEKGTGIGLLLSKEFVKANKGQIWLESEEGKGTTFYFSFKK